MNDKEKFEGSKDKLVQDNEDKFGVEIREKYGKDIVEKSNARFKNMTQEDFIKLNEFRANGWNTKIFWTEMVCFSNTFTFCLI